VDVPVERLQKILSAAGLASRRKAEELITAGRVEVNGETVTALGTKADPTKDIVRLDGERVLVPAEKTYLLLFKPRGYVSTLDDPQGRPTVKDLLPKGIPRVFHVGRLDLNTEGLLILTDDGAFAEKVAHPRHGCAKVYLAKVSGIPGPDALSRLRNGVVLDGVRTAPAEVALVRSTRRDGNAWLTLTLSEGRSRQVRRMLEDVGYPVSKLRRVRIGPIDDHGLEPGAFRALTPAEIKALARGKVGVQSVPPAGAARRARVRPARRPPRKR
jgi:pseudouridine synthase